MDVAQVFIFDLGWVFFIAWGTVLAAVSVIAFGQEILGFDLGRERETKIISPVDSRSHLS
jgi:hypothetical protein